MLRIRHWFPNHESVFVASLKAIFVTILWLGLVVGAKAQDYPVVVEKGLIRVEAPAEYQKYAEVVLGHATAAMRALNSQTGDALMVPVRFVIAPDKKQFLELAGSEGENSLAVADGSQRLVVISRAAMTKSAADKIQQVLVHELAHIYIAVKCHGKAPRWLHEGIAQMVAGDWPDAPGDARLTIAAYTGGLIPLRELMDTFPAGITRRNQAYAEALSVTRFLIREDYGNSLTYFLQAIRGDEGKRVLSKLNNPLELDALNYRWQNELKSPIFGITIILGSGIFWGFAAMLVIVAWFIKRNRSRKLHEEWAVEDAIWVDIDSGPELDEPEDGYLEGDGDEWKRRLDYDE